MAVQANCFAWCSVLSFLVLQLPWLPPSPCPHPQEAVVSLNLTCPLGMLWRSWTSSISVGSFSEFRTPYIIRLTFCPLARSGAHPVCWTSQELAFTHMHRDRRFELFDSLIVPLGLGTFLHFRHSFIPPIEFSVSVAWAGWSYTHTHTHDSSPQTYLPAWDLDSTAFSKLGGIVSS